MRLGAGMFRGIGGALLVGAIVGAVKGDPGVGPVLCAYLVVPILALSAVGATAGALLTAKGAVWMVGLGIVATAAALGLTGGWLCLAAARNSPEARDAMGLCILAGAVLAASTAGPPRKEENHGNA